jgi:DNA-binding beta-propeller fold protein YncE/mono/diheme cytochrome c family protein
MIEVFQNGKPADRIPVVREPVALGPTKDGKFLLVANHLPGGRADVEHVAAVVSVIDTAQRKVVQEISLPNGSTDVKGLTISPDGRFAAITHLVASFNRAATEVRFGWLNANALSFIEISRMELLGTVLLDTPTQGAANPWGVTWSADGKILVVAHAGTHEVSIIDSVPVLASLTEMKHEGKPLPRTTFSYLPNYEGLAARLPCLVGARRRVPLPEGDLGPREVAIVGRYAYATNYFSGTVTEINLDDAQTRSIRLAPEAPMTLERKGELYFHDARLCLQGWQSCASCHPDARVDGLNWDLVNDGIGNPKNTKSMLLAHRTPPAMSLGVRDTATTAVRSGIKHILFTEQPEDVAQAIDAYLKSLKPEPSPYLEKGKLSRAARRGAKIFTKSNCADCHPPGLFTDQQAYDVGTPAPHEKAGLQFDTPTLVELWRTAPYLHDGSAATVKEVITTRNPNDQHGQTQHLSPKEIDDLVAYLLSL